MRQYPLFGPIARGGVAALLATSVAVPARAQSGAAAGRGDSTGFGRLLIVTDHLDSIRVLSRELLETAPGTPSWIALQQKLESLLPSTTRLRVGRIAAAREPGYIGAKIGGAPVSEDVSPRGYFVQYYAHPTIVSVDPESPAQRVGLAPGDVILAYNGLDVVEHPYNRSELFAPGKKLLVTVRRDGETKEYSLVVGKASPRVFLQRRDLEAGLPRFPMEPDRGEDGPQRVPLGMALGSSSFPALGGGMVMFSTSGMFGASLSVVTAALSKALNIDRGVLVNDVPDGTVAARAGLQAGDVIASVAGEPVRSLAELHALVLANAGDRSISLEVRRERKARTITVTW